MARFTLKRTDASPGRAGRYKYGPASIWISGPAGGTWWATVRFLSQEKDLDARSLNAVLEKATRWVDDAPELARDEGRKMQPKKHAKAWEVWSRGDDHDEPMFVAAFPDKGQAQTRIKRLQRSHPYARYMLKHRRVPTRHLFESGRKTRLARAHHRKKTSERDPARRKHRTKGAPSFAVQRKISRKIRLLVREGYSPKQAAAIAYRTYGVARRSR